MLPVTKRAIYLVAGRASRNWKSGCGRPFAFESADQRAPSTTPLARAAMRHMVVKTCITAEHPTPGQSEAVLREAPPRILRPRIELRQSENPGRRSIPEYRDSALPRRGGYLRQESMAKRAALVPKSDSSRRSGNDVCTRGRRPVSAQLPAVLSSATLSSLSVVSSLDRIS